MNFDIDVSGNDLLKKNYVICIANNNGIIKGFKFSEELINRICLNHKQGAYKYKSSKKDKSSLKVRIYCVIIYYLFDSFNFSGDLTLNVCRDFTGRDNDIKKNLRFFLGEKLGLRLGDRIYFTKLSKKSDADKYAYMMRHDTKNQLSNYVKTSLEDIEKWLKK